MDILSSVTDIHASKGEVIRDLLALPIDTLSGIRSCLFEECRENGLTHPNDVITRRKGSAINSESKLLGEDVLSLSACLQNQSVVPRTIIRNGKRDSAALNSWRNSNKCRTEVNASRSAAASFSQSFMQEASIIDDHDSQPYCLPNPSSFASNIISRDINSLRAEVTTLKSQLSLLERHSDLGIIKNELQQMKSMLVDLSLKVSSPPCTTETSTTVAHTTPASENPDDVNVYTHAAPYQSSDVNTSEVPAVCTLAHQSADAVSLTPVFKIAAWNCRGLSKAVPYVEILAEEHDVIVLSEHWLWPFETHKFLNVHPNMMGLVTTDKRLTPESHLTYGCGGIGILWRKSLKVTPVSGVDSDRICAISIDTTSSPILVIGVYLPTSNSPIDEYRHCIHTIESLINRHRNMTVIIAGDFNAHIGATGGPRGIGDPNSQGLLLLDMIHNNDLYIPTLSCLSTGPLHTFFRGNTTTTTDYIIMDALHSNMVLTSTTIDNHPLNFSDHLPVAIHLSIPTPYCCTTHPTARLNWKAALEDGTVSAYAATVDEVIRPLLGKSYTSPAEVEDVLNLVSTNLSMAASSLITQGRTKPRRKKRFSNDPELKQLSSKCKAAWRKWRDAGRPSAGPLYEEKKRLKKLTCYRAEECRATLERHSWEKREELFSSKDPKRFKTPLNKGPRGERLMQDGNIISDALSVNDCWVQHFTEVFQSRAESNTNVSEAINQLDKLYHLSKMNCDGIIDDDVTSEEIQAAMKMLKSGKACGLDGLQAEHLIYGGPLLSIWLRQIFNAFISLECVPSCILTGIILPVYKGKGKDPLNCNSYRGISITPVIMKLFEYILLERILPVLQDNGHPHIAQTAYQKKVSCQDAIFTSLEAIRSTLRDGRSAYLSLYDLEKAFDSIEHAILLRSLFEAGVNGKSWRLIWFWYSNLTAVVRSGAITSSPIHILRGVQQGSVLSPIFFLVIMDNLLHQLSRNSCGASIYHLYLGGAIHADDVRAVASSTSVAEAQGAIISDFSSKHGLHLNSTKTEIVKISNSTQAPSELISLSGFSVTTLHQAKCLGFLWSSSLSAKSNVEHNINKARKQFFALGSSGCFLGYSNPLSAREVVESCVIPTLLYGAENWILDKTSLNLLERFQAELGRRILKLSKHHSALATLIGLSWPTMKARLLSQKLRFLGKLLSQNRDNIATRTFQTIASDNVYNTSIVDQCIFLDALLGTNSTAHVLSNLDSVEAAVKSQIKSIKALDAVATLEDANNHQSVKLAKDVNWLKVWDAARDRGRFWTGIVQCFYKLLTTPLFGERICWKCNSPIPPGNAFIEHLSSAHVTTSISLDSLMSDLTSNSDLTTNILHCMKSMVYSYSH